MPKIHMVERTALSIDGAGKTANLHPEETRSISLTLPKPELQMDRRPYVIPEALRLLGEGAGI